MSSQAPNRISPQEIALTTAGYKIAARDPKVKPDFEGAFMVIDPDDAVDGYAIVGNDRDELIKEAYGHLFDIEQAQGLPVAVPYSAMTASKQQEFNARQTIGSTTMPAFIENSKRTKGKEVQAICHELEQALPDPVGYAQGYRDALESITV